MPEFRLNYEHFYARYVEMKQSELEALEDMTPTIGEEVRTINGKRVIVPVQKGVAGALFTGHDDGVFRCLKTGQRYMVGQHNGRRVKVRL